MQTSFGIPPLRKGHRLDVDGTSCYWFEMDHAGERACGLIDLFDQYLNQNNWDKFIRPGSTVIDIGGHSGDTAVIMQFLARGTVLSAEPNPTIKPYLDFCCNMNAQLGKFVTAGEAVTTTNVDSLEILDHNNNLCNGGMIDQSWSPELQERMRAMSSKKVTCAGLTLENMLNKYLTPEEIENISFIKSDTEGHDVSIIESSADLIDRIRPVIFIEWFWMFTDVENQHMFQVIQDLGYTAFEPQTLQPASIDRRTADLVLIHNSKINDYL
jgi:FkbM family methyltransferase